MTARKLSHLFNVEPGEGRLVALMLACSFFVGSSGTLAGTAAYALFLSQFGAQGLPYVYLVMSLVGTLSSFAYIRLSERLALPKLLILIASLVFLVILGVRLGLSLTSALWLTFALPVVSDLTYSLTTLTFWNLAGRVFNVRQAKRLFGLIGGGCQLAKAAGGFVIPVLVIWIGTPNLLLAAAAATGCTLGLLLCIVRSQASSLASTVDETERAKGQPSSSAWWKNRYIVLILGLYAFVVIMWCTLDIVFYDQAGLRFAGEERLASFLGLFFGIVGLLNLVGSTFLTGPFLSRHGVRAGLSFTPLILMAGGTVVVAVGTAFGTTATFFWLVAAMCLAFYVLSTSVDMPILNILYQPLPASQRVKTQTLVEGVVYSISVGLSGAGLWALTTLWGFGSVQLSYVVLLFTLAWAGAAIALAREYPHRLRQALAKRRLGAAPLTVMDGSTQAVLQRELRSPSPGVVSYALTMLEAMGRELVAACLPGLLDHPAPEVRQDVLQRIERLGVTDAAAAVRQRVAQEPSPAVRGAALRTLASLAGPEALEALASYLQDPEPEVRRGAMVGLLRNGGIEGVLAAGNRLLQMATSSQPVERALAAQVLAWVGAEGFYQPLLSLLRDGDRRVRQAALRAAGQIRSTPLWPLVIEGLDSPSVRGAAVSALVCGGDAAMPALAASFAKAAAQAGKPTGTLPRTQRRLVSVGGRIGGTRAVAWLKGHVAHPDSGVRTQVLHALCRCGYQAPAGEAPQVAEQIKAEATLSARVLATLVDIGQDGSVELLQSALGQVLAECRTRIFFLLSFLYRRQSILQARDNLSLASADRRAYALEVLDVLVGTDRPDLKRMFFPLLSDLPADQKGQQMRAAFPQLPMTCQQRLEEIIADSSGRYSAWTQACALYAAGRSPAVAPAAAVARAAAAPDPLVRETALWAVSRLDAGFPVSTTPPRRGLGAVLVMSSGHPKCTDGKVPVGFPASGTDGNGEDSMLTTVEKVIALKRAAVFAEVPDEILAELASCLEEVEHGAGQAVFKKGDLGDCMYIIADGRVRIHDGDRTLNDLCAGEVFGEMAVLDAEPRSASATAAVDSLLLRLDQEPLYEVMEDRIEVTRGIVRMLCQRLRARLSDLEQLHTQLER